MTLQKQRKALLAALLLSLGNNVDAVTSDSNCQCATARSSAATPNYNASVLAGCRFDVGEQVSAGQKWCLTNQSTSTPGCGQFIQYIGWVDQCDQAKFTFFGVGPSQKLEWDQDPTEFYQGQSECRRTEIVGHESREKRRCCGVVLCASNRALWHALPGWCELMY